MRGAAAVGDLTGSPAFISRSWRQPGQRTEAAIAAAPDTATRRALVVVRAGLLSHRLALAHTHVRLNAAQLHNAIRQRLDIAATPDRLVLLHALRLTLIKRIWLLAVSVPDFSPRHGATRDTVPNAMLRLEVEPALAALEEIFPALTDPAGGLDFCKPAPPREGTDYAREHAAIFQPIRRLFALTRECSAAIAHEVGAFG